MIRVLICAAAFGFGPGALSSHLAQIVQQRAYAHASFGGAVYDLDGKRFIYELDAGRYFLAASTAKLLTEGTSLAVLGARYRFRTNVYRTGAVDAEGTLHGDIVLRASGDPNLSGRVRNDGTLAFENQDHSYDGGPETTAVHGDPLLVLRALAQQVAARGIKRVSGRVIVDDTLYTGGFAEAGTGAVVSPMMLNDNIVDVIVRAGAKPGDPAQFAVSPQTAYARFVSSARTSAHGTPRTISLDDGDEDASGAQTVRIAGNVPAGSPPVLYAYDVPSPRRFAEMAFTGVLQRAGVNVAQSGNDAAPDAGTLRRWYHPQDVIASHLSAPLSEDVKVTLKVSDNLHADAMPYLWANGDLRAAYALERSFLSRGGLESSGMVQNDGLGSDAFVQPQFMARYLAYIARQPFFRTLERSLPVMGVDGTLYDVEVRSPARGKVFAKTGTWSARDALNRRNIITAKGLAGYMTTKSGRRVAFCFYVNNLAVPAGQDAAYVAGEALGRLATQTYLFTP
jgi:PBP4 family serine-type D-alanyl-D-alanine carboxypeptidase